MRDNLTNASMSFFEKAHQFMFYFTLCSGISGILAFFFAFADTIFHTNSTKTSLELFLYILGLSLCIVAGAGAIVSLGLYVILFLKKEL